MTTEPQRNLGRDLSIELLDARLLPVYRVADALTRGRAERRGVTTRDFVPRAGRDNLGQALLMRLLTPLGELAPLGHHTYGARLYEVIGAPNSATTRNLAKLHVLAALAQERRVAKVNSVEVTPHPVLRDLIRIAVAVLPVGADVPLAISFDLSVEGEA